MGEEYFDLPFFVLAVHVSILFFFISGTVEYIVVIIVMIIIMITIVSFVLQCIFFQFYFYKSLLSSYLFHLCCFLPLS